MSSGSGAVGRQLTNVLRFEGSNPVTTWTVLKWQVKPYKRRSWNAVMTLNRMTLSRLRQGILKGKVSLYHWPPVWPVWISLFCKKKMSVIIQLIPNQSNRRSPVQWCFPLWYSLIEAMSSGSGAVGRQLTNVLSFEGCNQVTTGTVWKWQKVY